MVKLKVQGQLYQLDLECATSQNNDNDDGDLPCNVACLLQVWIQVFTAKYSFWDVVI